MDEESEIIFHEQQKFASWVYLVVLTSVILSLSIVGFAMKEEYVKGNPPDKGDYISLLIVLAIAIVFMILFMFLKMQTMVSSDSLYVRVFPFQIRYRKFTSQQISEAYYRRYRPIMEYGGWGIRYSLKHGRAYNARGNEGLQLILMDDKKILIGSQKAEELEKAVKHIIMH